MTTISQVIFGDFEGWGCWFAGWGVGLRVEILGCGLEIWICGVEQNERGVLFIGGGNVGRDLSL